MIVERFAGFAQCPNDACREAVVLAGSTMNDLIPDEVGYSQVLVPSLMPSFVVPAPYIIPLSDEYPTPVSESIRRAFDLYWVDSAATANAIRIAVEAVMRHYRIKKRGSDGKPLALHNRIDHHFRPKFPAAADYLLAIKWIGNAGSHDGPPPTNDGVLDAFDLLDHALHLLFVQAPHSRRVDAITKQVIKTKKPRKARPLGRKPGRS